MSRAGASVKCGFRVVVRGHAACGAVFVAYFHLPVEISGYYRYIRIVMSGFSRADAVSSI